jgi:hypothetical protein
MRSSCVSAPVLLLAVTTIACGGTVVTTEAVSGTVLDAYGAPLPGAPVLIDGIRTSTDAAGRFSVGDVAIPYDVSIVEELATHAAAHVYLGMSDPAPTYRLLYVPGSFSKCTLTVTLPTTPTPTLDASVIFEVPDGSPRVSTGDVSDDVNLQPPHQSFQLEWPAPAAQIRVHAFEIQRDPATGAPVHYVGYDTTEVALANGVDVAWSVSWKPPPFSEKAVSATVDVPQGYTFRGTAFVVSGSSSAFGNWLEGSTAGLDASLMVPELPGASFALSAFADGDGGRSAASLPPVAPGTQGLHLAIDHAPILIAPADGGTLDVGSPVTWTSDGEGVPFVQIVSSDVVSAPMVHLFGGDGSATLPDLSALGVALPHAVSYEVQVFRTSAAATVDELAPQGASFLPHTPYTTGSSASHQVTTP